MDVIAVDAFSGAGGLSLGLTWAGVEVIFSFDNDTNSVQTQKSNPKYLNHPVELASIETMLYGGLLDKLRIKPGELFLLAGGPPCQGFSIQRIGEDTDFRNELVFKFMALVGETQPRFFLMENVPGITGKRGKKILEHALKHANDLGYWIHKKVLDAQDFGVPQRRKRVFVVGEINDGRLPAFQFPIPGNLSKKTVKDAISHLPPPPEDGSDHPNIPHHRRDKLSDLNKRRLSVLRQGEGRDQLPEELLVEAHKVSSSIIGHRNVYGRMHWDKVAPTITARFDSFTRGQFGHPDQIRSISLREGALLQTFPEDFVFSGNKVDIARQIGNAVPPLLAKTIAEQLLICYREKFGGE